MEDTDAIKLSMLSVLFLYILGKETRKTTDEEQDILIKQCSDQSRDTFDLMGKVFGNEKKMRQFESLTSEDFYNATAQLYLKLFCYLNNQ